ncbi:hypothetical protein U1Q18_037068 [Sarracenia purpurea var. burkii]
MDLEINCSESRGSRSSTWTSSAGCSLRRHSFNFSNAAPPQKDDDLESETVSEAGDIGDRELRSSRHGESGRLRLSADNATESGTVVPIPEDALYGFPPRDPTALTTASPVSPTTLEIISPLSTDAIMHSEVEKQENKKELPWLLEYSSCLVHLAVFGILGVLTRYLLQKLFGPGVIGATSNQSILYLDLPSNMVGSFLMGWWGVVFKGDISRVSNYLAIGLTTGYLGSLTTFSGWNQKMLDLSVEGKWVFVALGFVIGFFLADYSIIFGVKTALSFKWLLKTLNNPNRQFSSSKSTWNVNNPNLQFAVMVVLLLMLGLLWGISGALERREFPNGNAQLWLACIVGPFGVWIRWFLARLNGRGLGKRGLLKWVPFGTLIANVSAACVMAALATLQKAVTTKACYTVTSGIQFGLMGCLSTVSTFIAEVHAMRESNHPWRAYVYALITIVMSFGLGTLIYSVPVWARGYID